jgi:hypothetical protein
MDNLEENGSNVDPNSSSDQGTSVSSASATSNIVQLISAQQNAHQVSAHFTACLTLFTILHLFQSVIQPNHAQSVIQTATGIQPVKSVLLVNSKNPNSVIHTTHQAIQVRKCAPF